MIVWTHHRHAFPLTAPDLVIDPTKGHYWNVENPVYRDRYRRILRQLQELLGTTQFLWCCLEQGEFVRTTEGIDLVEWELDIPESHVASLYRENVWEDLYNGRAEEWDKLLIDGLDLLGEKAGALVRVPIDPTWATCREIPVLSKKTRRRG